MEDRKVILILEVMIVIVLHLSVLAMGLIKFLSLAQENILIKKTDLNILGK